VTRRCAVFLKSFQKPGLEPLRDACGVWHCGRATFAGNQKLSAEFHDGTRALTPKTIRTLWPAYASTEEFASNFCRFAHPQLNNSLHFTEFHSDQANQKLFFIQ
jgi:hypothetical protein